MILTDVYSDLSRSAPVLFDLLREREPHESISHKKMPSYDHHLGFMGSHPYAHWYLADADGYARGAVYLTHQREIGVQILKGQRGHGYALDAVSLLMRLHPGRFLANIAPGNFASIELFRKLGFGGPVQITMAKEP